VNTEYINLVEQTLSFPQEEFKIADNKLTWHGINLMELTATCGAPLKFTYPPNISENSNKAKEWFQNSIQKHKYIRDYFYRY
jgi:arginine decarboxylase